jgi:NAD(P)-dependent dehydrogenase (short-subunit alcohol dehydrogenase family)
MRLAGRTAVVTGGASGIGGALARAFAAEGASGVAIADRDGDGAQRVAQEIGPAALSIRCDVSDGADLERLICRVEDAFGPIDLFCANAGVARGAGLGADDSDWALAWEVNVRAHVLAARALVPRWLERGEGYFLSTASAAGLLTQIGSAPYAVTKHAAVGFAEWLSVTYGDRGIRVSCLCPMGVETPLLGAGLGAGDDDQLAARVVRGSAEVLAPPQVAEIVVAALREEHFLILPHPEVLEFFRRKAHDYEGWIAGMRRLQARFRRGADAST